MSRAASKMQEKVMSVKFRGKEIFKPLNTGSIDERVKHGCYCKKAKGNRYKVRWILATDGSAFVLPEMANAVSTSVGGFTEAAKSSGEVTPAINTASDEKISRMASNVKPDIRHSLKTDSHGRRLTGAQEEYFKAMRRFA